jgi:hypothetical protein
MGAVAELKAMLGLDPARYNAGMKSAQKSTSTFQDGLAKVTNMIGGAFSAGAAIAFAKNVFQWGSKLSETAQKAGVLTSEMAALNKVALQNGMDVDQATNMLAKMQTKLGDAIENGGEAEKAFTNIGLSLEDMAKLAPADMLQAVARAAVESGDPLNALADIIGERLGPTAVATFRDLAENGLGAVDDALGETADRVEELGDKFAAMLEGLKSTSLKVGNSIAEFFNDLVHVAVADFTGVDPMQMLEQLDKERELDSRQKKQVAEQKQREVKEARQKKLAQRRSEDAAAAKIKVDKLATDSAEKERAKQRRIAEEVEGLRVKMVETLEDLGKKEDAIRAGEGADGLKSTVDELSRRGGMSRGGGVGQFEIASKQLAIEKEILEIIKQVVDTQNNFKREAAERGGM